MGCGIIGIEEEEAKSLINIATLVFSGAGLSPFEFYSVDKNYKENHDEKNINKIFKKNSKFTDENRIRLKKLDARIKKERYSPLYRKNCGVRNGIFENKQEFQKTWLQVFNAEALSNNEDLKKEYGLIIKEETLDPDLQQLRKFDYFCYEAILQFLYDINDVTKIKKKMSVMNYCQFIEKSFSKPYLHQKKKIQNIISFALEKEIDVFFIQSATEQLRLAFEKKTDYRILMSEDTENEERKKRKTMLLVNEKSFKKASDGRKGNRKFLQIFRDKHFEMKRKEQFLRVGESVVLSIGNFIFLGVNLTDTTEEQEKRFQEENENSPNREEVLHLIEDIKTLQKYFPKKYVVVGGNMGYEVKEKIKNYFTSKNQSYLGHNFMIYPTERLVVQENMRSKKNCPVNSPEPQKTEEKTEANPNLPKYFTTLKKPTSMQLSYEDIEKNEVMLCCDQIIYDKRLKIKQKEVHSNIKNKTGRYTIDQALFTPKQNEKFYMPNEIHPFSHLVVVKTLKVPKRIEKIYENTLIKQEYMRELISSSSSDRSSKFEGRPFITQTSRKMQSGQSEMMMLD